MTVTRRAAGLAAVVVLALAASGCGGASATAAPPETSVPIGATPWANGTVGQYGLRIDPSLLKRLPIAVGGIAMAEDADSEQALMDDATLTDIDRMAGAKYGTLGNDTDFVQVWVIHFKADKQNGDAYGQWVDTYAAGACSQANGIADVSQETINNWLVDVTVCNGGPITAYSLAIGDGVTVSMFGMGPKDLGKLLISHLF